MSPDIAAVVFALGILGLFWLDRDPTSRVSPALWIPAAWIGLAGSRMVSEWLQIAPKESPEQYLEGNPLDRLVLTALLAVGVTVLLTRAARTRMLLRANGPIVLFFLYGALSILWSDYADVAFKRWTKAVGDVVMVLVVLTEADPSASVKRLLQRIGFFLIPLSVLFIKYYPELGRSYSPWNAAPYYHGVAMGKNGLGYVCLIFGLASLWRVLEVWRSGNRRGPWGPSIAHGTVLAMALWLLWKADSATSVACLLIGAVAMTVTSMPRLRSSSTPVHLLVGAVLFVWVSALVFDVSTDIVEAMGRDTTLTGRTTLWDEVLRLTVDPLFGTGFESFWLGTRLETLWRLYWWHPNQAHNGYLEVFLNLGAAGLVLLAAVMVWGYRNVVESFRRDPATCGLRLAYFLVAALYNLTEAAFKGLHLVWIALLLAIMTVPDPSSPRRP